MSVSSHVNDVAWQEICSGLLNTLRIDFVRIAARSERARDSSGVYLDDRL
jgi:hypothetical protein